MSAETKHETDGQEPQAEPAASKRAVERVLDIGAGRNPHTEATHTLDIRTDLDHIDYPGVDVSREEFPVPDASFDRIVCRQLMEHLDRSRLTHFFYELDRVLRVGGSARIEVPHARTFGAVTDPTHRGPGGFTAAFDWYFKDGGQYDYWNELDWKVRSVTSVEFPSFVRPAWRLKVRTGIYHLSYELMAIPFVCGKVIIHITKRGPRAVDP